MAGRASEISARKKLNKIIRSPIDKQKTPEVKFLVLFVMLFYLFFIVSEKHPVY